MTDQTQLGSGAAGPSAKLLVLVLLAAGLATRFAWIAHPDIVIFDEQYFSVYAQAYFHGNFFFDVQPPLGELILFSALRTAHFNPDDAPFTMDEPYPQGYPYVAGRLLPALAGALLPLVIFWLARALGLSPAASFFAGMMVVLDTAIAVESHYALIDIFVPFFGYGGLAAFLHHRKERAYSAAWWRTLAGAALLGALALSVKWSGASAFGVMGAVALWDVFAERAGRFAGSLARSFGAFLIRAAMLTAVAAAVYLAVFAVHFRLLPNSGDGDGYVSANFDATLKGSDAAHQLGVAPLDFWHKFTELNVAMYAYDLHHMTFYRPFRSYFYEWPVAEKPIAMTGKKDSQPTVWLRGNPVVWYFGLSCLVAGIVFLIARRQAIRALYATSEDGRQKLFALGFLALVYFADWLPFAAITRNLYLYHYFSALLASILIGSLLVFDLAPALGFWGARSGKPEMPKRLYWILLGLAALGFVALAPGVYGFHWPAIR